MEHHNSLTCKGHCHCGTLTPNPPSYHPTVYPRLYPQYSSWKVHCFKRKKNQPAQTIQDAISQIFGTIVMRGFMNDVAHVKQRGRLPGDGTNVDHVELGLREVVSWQMSTKDSKAGKLSIGEGTCSHSTWSLFQGKPRQFRVRVSESGVDMIQPSIRKISAQNRDHEKPIPGISLSEPPWCWNMLESSSKCPNEKHITGTLW